MVDHPVVSDEVGGAKGETRTEEPTRNERTIVRRSAEARATIPDLELSTEVDMGACMALLSQQSCSVTSALVRACALALREVPRANGAWRDGRFELYSRVNVGISIATEDGYAIPTVFDADRKTLQDLEEELGGLVSRARLGQLTSPELSGATFTLTDLGSYGVARSTVLISPPQAAGVAAGAVREVPVLRDRAIVPGLMMTLTLGCDHRILHGTLAAGFLSRIETLLAEAQL